jgi:uncharacterized membrane protein
MGAVNPDVYEAGSDQTRVLALTDGVFAIVITLLVLEIQVPELSGGGRLAEALDQIRPSFIAFIISFVVVAIAWAGHRDLFALIRRADRELVWLNLMYLLPLCLIPFGASLLARSDGETVALQLYGGMLLLTSLTRLAIWLYATNRPHLLLVPIDRRSRRAGVAIVAIPGAAYALAIVVAEVSPGISLLIYAMAPLLYIIAVTFIRSSAPTGSAGGQFT